MSNKIGFQAPRRQTYLAHFLLKSIRQGAGTPTPTYGFLRQGVLGSENKHRAFSLICALSGHLSAVTSAAVKVTTAQAGKLHPTLAFEKRQETRSPMKDRVSMVRAAALRCTLKRSQCGCAVRIGLAVEESLHLAQALSQKGALLTKKTKQVETYGMSWSDACERCGCKGQEIKSKKPACRFLQKKKFVFSKAPPMTRTTFEKNFSCKIHAFNIEEDKRALQNRFCPNLFIFFSSHVVGVLKHDLF